MNLAFLCNTFIMNYWKERTTHYILKHAAMAGAGMAAGLAVKGVVEEFAGEDGKVLGAWVRKHLGKRE